MFHDTFKLNFKESSKSKPQITSYPLDKLAATDKTLPLSMVRRRIIAGQRIVSHATKTSLKSSTNRLTSIDGLLKSFVFAELRHLSFTLLWLLNKQQNNTCRVKAMKNIRFISLYCKADLQSRARPSSRAFTIQFYQSRTSRNFVLILSPYDVSIRELLVSIIPSLIPRDPIINSNSLTFWWRT